MSFAEEIFSTKTVPGSVTAELDARASSKFQNGMSGQKTWCHIMSMADGASYPISTYNSFSTAYPEANRPAILVQSLDVKSHGEYGTMRRASVKLKVFTDKGMNELAKGYFIPNMSIRLQFGWSTGIKKNPAAPITGVMSDGVANKAIRAQSQSSPTYDGFQGRIVSWEFSLADDQSWDVTLDLIGAAAAIANIPANDETACYCEQKSPAQPTPGGDPPPADEEEAKTKTSALQSSLIRLIDDPGQGGALASQLKLKKLDVGKFKFNGYERDQAGTEDTSAPWYTFGFGDPSVGTEEAFITFGSLCRLIERTCAQPWSSNGRPAVLEIDCDDVDVSNYGFSLWSADPRVCILQGSPYSLANVGGTNKSYDGKLSNIYVNCIHALRVAKGLRDQDDGVVTLLTALLRDINNVCGNGWEFDIIDVSDKGGSGAPTGTRISIIDLNLHKSDAGAYEFKSGVNGKSNVRSVEMSLKPTEAMKTLALYSNASKDKAPASVQNCSDRFIRYAEAASVKNLADDKTSGDKPKPCGGDKCSEEPEGDDPLTALTKEVNDKTVASAKSYQVEQRKSKDNDVCNKAVMPFQLSVTITGIGGFAFGQLVSLDRLPETLKTKINYQVTAVEHSITPDDWTTKINTVGRLK